MARGRRRLALALLSLTGWVALAFGRGGFWRIAFDAERTGPRRTASRARVEAVVPARDEARTIGAAVASLAVQRWAGPFAVTVVDDESSDGTAALARASVAALGRDARVAVVSGRTLEPPWTGKLNALDCGIARVLAERGRPEFWLFTDADIEHDPDNLAELVAKAERDGLDLVSLMVRLRCETPWEKLLVPAFVFFFAKLYPFAWSNDPRRATAAAAGGCVLVRGAALERIGGLSAIADRLIDDCALAAAIKRSGGTTWIGASTRTASIRSYDTLASFWNMVKRTAFTQLGRSLAATIFASLGMTVLYAAPPALALDGAIRRDPRVATIAAGAWSIMGALYLPTLRAYGRPAREAPLLPVAATLYVAMTLDSALADLRGRGGSWKGRRHRGAPSPTARCRRIGGRSAPDSD